MQILQRFLSIFLTFLLIFGVLSPFGFSFAIQDKYDYAEFSDKIKISGEKIFGNTFDSTILFDSPRTSFSLRFENYHYISSDDVKIEWKVGDKVFIRELDIDEGTPSDFVMTYPLVTSARTDISFHITFSGDIPKDITLITSNQDSIGKKIIFQPGAFITYADNSGVRVVSRAEWGADESIRYVSSSYREKTKQEWIARGSTPRIIVETDAEKQSRVSTEKQFNSIESLHPDATNVVSVKRYDGQNKLIWPIKKTKKVEKIVVHHTAESLDQDADDMTLLRAIYLYHARSRGWGDIGYNYVIGQRGTIYEGRSGGDYVEGAHVYGNNAGTVGISVIGNYNDLHLNKDQKAGLTHAIVMMAQKYGIDILGTFPGAHVCKSDASCKWEVIYTPGLIGHRDLASTGCPGDSLYDIIPELRNTVVGKVGKVSPQFNTNAGPIDSLDPEDEVSYILKSSSNKTSVNVPSQTKNKTYIAASVPKSSDIQNSPTRSAGGRLIKIRLSYPLESISLEGATKKIPNARLGTKKVSYMKGQTLNISLSGKSGLTVKIGTKEYKTTEFSLTSDIIRIPSWSRVPLWDTNKRYNDNLFRNKIIVKNNNGKLLVINELPIEDYVKGLGEVSNSDLPEKIKTILVAARTYAYFYAELSHRKYNTTLYDGSDDPNEFQKYLGYSLELRSPDIAKLADTTRREIITYKGELIKPWYFTSSDGNTRSFLEYCISNGGKSCQDIAYLQSVDDPAGVGRERQGHGVGISGVGASYGATLGKSYKEIIAYYLKGVEILKK